MDVFTYPIKLLMYGLSYIIELLKELTDKIKSSKLVYYAYLLLRKF
jgi:hypothetical protein